MTYKVLKNGHACLGKFNSREAAKDAVKRNVDMMLKLQRMPIVIHEVLIGEMNEVHLYQSLDDLHFEIYLITQVIE